MNRRSRSTLFLMEQLIVIAVFALCAAACVRILASSYIMTTQASDTSNAIRVAESSAECYKAVSGDLSKMVDILGGSVLSTEDTALIYYDKSWNVCDESDLQVYYLLRLDNEASQLDNLPLVEGVLTVEKSSVEEIISFPVTAIRWSEHE